MLAVYTFVFGSILQSRWPGLDEDSSIVQFALVLFGGLTFLQLFSDTVLNTTNVIVANSTYVKKVVFPLHFLPAVTVVASAFHAGINMCVYLIFMFFVFGTVPLSAVFIPVILLIFIVMMLGLGWFLASLGTYVRDLRQSLSAIVTASMFLAPIFYPITVMPEWIRGWLSLNPLTIPVMQLRQVSVAGEFPDAVPLVIYAFAALTFAVLGYVWFRKSQHGFADVL